MIASGMQWKIGNGKAVNIWQDSWIPNETGRRVVSAQSNCYTLKTVSELIDHQSKCWNFTLVTQIFQLWEAWQILKIPVYQQGCKDTRIWKADKSGKFTVSSAYKLACTIHSESAAPAEANRTREEKSKMWKLLWQLNIKAKLKHFLWRCVHNWLATGEALKGRGMDIDDRCKRCGLETETREHLMFHCPESELIWKLAPLRWDRMLDHTYSFEDWWRSLSSAQKDQTLVDRIELTIYLMWFIWKSRCVWQFEGQRWVAKEVVQKAMVDWQEFIGMLEKKKQKKGSEKTWAYVREGHEEYEHQDIIVHMSYKRQENTGQMGNWMDLQ